jgi:hypothetical protein
MANKKNHKRRAQRTRDSDGLRDLKDFLGEDLLRKIHEMGLYPEEGSYAFDDGKK